MGPKIVNVGDILWPKIFFTIERISKGVGKLGEGTTISDESYKERRLFHPSVDDVGHRLRFQRGIPQPFPMEHSDF